MSLSRVRVFGLFAVFISRNLDAVVADFLKNESIKVKFFYEFVAIFLNFRIKFLKKLATSVASFAYSWPSLTVCRVMNDTNFKM